MYMQNRSLGFYIGGVATALAMFVVASFFHAQGDTFLQGVQSQFPQYKSENASSTAMTIGPQEAVQILGERSLRTYTKICLDSGASGTAHILWADDSQVGTTTNTVAELQAGECEEWDADNSYADVWRAVGLAATTTNSLLVTELFDD